MWPEHPEANDPSQYLHLNTTLIAPLECDVVVGPDQGKGSKGAQLPTSSLPTPPLPTSRSVWIPPGEWQDGWTGEAVTGPKTMQVTPTESAGKYHIPMWHKRGGIVVAVQEGEQRINSQDWSELTIEAFPAGAPSAETRVIFEQEGSPHGDATSTTVELATDGAGTLHLAVSASAAARSWLVRLHLRPGERLVLSDDALFAMGGVSGGSVRHLEPPPRAGCKERHDYFPFSGAGTAPACEAGAIAEFRLASSTTARQIEATLVTSSGAGAV